MEALVALFGALIELVAAAIQLCLEVVALVLETLGFAAGSLAEKPQAGEARFSGKRVLVAFAPLTLILVFIGGTFGLFQWRANARRAKIEATRTLIDEHVTRLAEQVDEQGQFKKHPRAPRIGVNDAWGNPLHVAYEETLVNQVVTVRSAGPDGEMNTLDDLDSSRRRLRPKKEIARNLLDKAKNAIENRNDRDE